ncbi:hypothetical protein BT93_J0056 [Corymbia citriodora subsp. variegata]|nr:hypothetical protein BT93_J0056 [Corymbia citriodora subsp. variegata]
MKDKHKMKPTPSRPHVLLFPFPVQSHASVMLKLAELLCLADLDVTFLNSDHIQSRLLRSSDVESRFGRYPGFRFTTITDGLPEDHPRRGYGAQELFRSMKAATRPVFGEMLLSGRLRSASGTPVMCVIADGLLTFAVDFAKEIGVRCFLFRTTSAACFWANLCIPKLIEAGELPFKGNDLDKPVKNVPGMEKFLRRGDLPSYCRSVDAAETTLQFIANESQQNARADALIFNTFEELESPILTHIRNHGSFPELYAIGPLHVHLKSRLVAANANVLVSRNNGILREDRSCMGWLNDQPPKSVVFVSFGGLVVITREQVMELWYGLVNSGVSFLWVLRPDSVAEQDGSDRIPAELAEATNQRGYLVAWAPQEEVLAHLAIGCFLSHGGWNSTLEAVAAGIPMICWPCFADQTLNSRFVGRVWRNGVDVKDACDRAVVERAVRDLMDPERDGGEFRDSAERMAKLAGTSSGFGGLSYRHLERLILDIKNMAAHQN